MDKKVIAISGPPGSGSTTASRALAEKLGINAFSPGRLFKDIATGKFKEQHYSELFLKICEGKNLKIPEMNSEYDSDGAIQLWDTKLGKSKAFHEAIDELQVELANQGNIIVDGKLSLNMIKNASPKVWLKADLESRARRVAKRENLSEAKAFEIIKRKQELEREEWKKIYGVDYWEQESKADIIIDTSSLTSEQVIEKILQQI